MAIDRRNFLKGLGALVGGIALEEAIPFGRVWSFPREIKIADISGMRVVRTEAYEKQAALFAAIYYDKTLTKAFNSGGFLSVSRTRFKTPDPYARVVQLPLRAQPRAASQD